MLWHPPQEALIAVQHERESELAEESRIARRRAVSGPMMSRALTARVCQRTRRMRLQANRGF